MARPSNEPTGGDSAPETQPDEQREEPPATQLERIYFGEEFWRLVFRTIGSDQVMRVSLQRLRRALEEIPISFYDAALIRHRLEKATEAWLREKNGRWLR